MFDSVHTWNQLRMIMNEKLLTHKPTHRVASRDKGINSVMGFKKKQHGEHKHYICPFRVLFHTEIWCDVDEFVSVFVCFLNQLRLGDWRRCSKGTVTRCRPFCSSACHVFQLQKSHSGRWAAVIGPLAGDTTSHFGGLQAITCRYV